MAPRILIADDEEPICRFLARLLESEPWDVETVSDAGHLVEQLRDGGFDLVVLDLHMPPYDGLDLLAEIKRLGVECDVVVLTGYGTVEVAVDAMKVGARDFLTKPVNSAAFLDTVRRVMDRRRPLPHVLASRLDDFTREKATDSSLRLSHLCEAFHISERYVCRLFQEHAESSFRQRLGYYRIERAKQLLMDTDMAIYEVAENSGFKNQRRLTESFRRYEGTTPRKYRTSQRDASASDPPFVPAP